MPHLLIRKEQTPTFSRSKSTGVGESGGACLSTSVMRPLPLMLPMTYTPAAAQNSTFEHG